MKKIGFTIRKFAPFHKGYVGLAHQRQFPGAVRGDEGDHVGVHAKTGPGHLEVIGHHHVQILLCQLGGGVFHKIFRLHGKTTQELVGLLRADGAQNVRRALHRDGQVAVLFLDLVAGHGHRAVVRHGGGHDQHIGGVKAVGDGFVQILCGGHRNIRGEFDRRQSGLAVCQALDLLYAREEQQNNKE